MAIERYDVSFERLDSAQLAEWAKIPPAIVSDCMNRTQSMSSTIRPIAEGTVLCGPARTVMAMAGDNSAIHSALRYVQPGDVLVIDAGRCSEVAVWGGTLARAAQALGVAGLVIDGAVRDVAEMRELGFPCYASAIVPRGPHKGFGGVLDGLISCGGCPVRPGDIVLGDDDGIAIVPLDQQAKLLTASHAKLEQEVGWVKAIDEGTLMADVLGLPEPDVIG